MKDLYLTLPPFAPDYGGACEAMYEFGGLILIHDASGCTVNYVSFDEPRFHEKPGMVYCSGLTEIDAVMGNDEVLIEKAIRASRELHPNFIAFIGSSVPMIVGTDFTGIAKETEERTGIPCFGFDTNGIRSYVEGASDVLYALLDRFAYEKTENKGTLLLGLLPLDDNRTSTSRKIRKMFPDLRSSLSFHCKFSDLSDAQNAERCVVVSASGLKAAKLLNERYGIPYSIGLPLKEVDKPHGSTLIIGEDVRAFSLAKALKNADALDLFSKEGLAKYHTADEETIRAIASSYDNVIGDPVFRSLTNKNFISLPTVSVSGGIFEDEVSPLDTEKIAEMLI